MQGELLKPIIEANFFKERLMCVRDLITSCYRDAFRESEGWRPGNRAVSLPHRRLALINETLYELMALGPDIAVDEFLTEKLSYQYTAFRMGSAVITHHYRQKSGQSPRKSSNYPRQLTVEKLDLFPDYQFSELQPPDGDGHFIVILHGSAHPVSLKPDFMDIGLPRDGDCKLIDIVSMEDAIELAPSLEIPEPMHRPEVVIEDEVRVDFETLPNRKES